MNQNECWTILELDEGSTPQAVEAAFSTRSADLSRRIAGAATRGLRQKYEQQAERLRQARDRLLGSGHSQRTPAPLSLTKQSDLPARTPMTAGAGRGAESGRDRVPGENSTWPEDGPLTLTQRRDLPASTSIRSFGGGVSSGSELDSAPLGISVGQVLAERYEVRDHLGSGGMGAVFAAFDRVRDEEIAIKVLLPHLLTDPKARERFLSEARIASSLSHPNIVRVFDVHQTVGLTFLTMERLRGSSLREDIARRQQTAERFSVAEVRGIAVPLCEALQTAHGQTVHRDVKPENIWMGEDGMVKLMDFGIARLLRPSQFTSTGLALGTAYYMAPEQLRGQEADHRADQFALGVILYELLTGEIPQGAIKAPHVVRRSVPAGMSDAVMRALEGRPEARHADMAALGRALASRSKSWVGKRAVVAPVVALLLGAAVTFPVWRTWIAGLRLKGDSTLATGIPEATAETKAAESAYGKQWSQVEELRKQAEAIGGKIESGARNAPDEAAKQVADLWGRHPRRKEWFRRAAGLRDSARAAAEKHAFDQAGSDLKSAEAEYRKPEQWSSNARQAMESINQTRAAVQKQLERFPVDSARLLLSWPEALTVSVEDKLLEGDGEEGLSEARRLSERLPEIGKLFAQRQDVVEAARAAQDSTQAEECRPLYEAAGARMQEADAALVKDRLPDADRLYRAAKTDFRAVLTALDGHINGLLTRGKADLGAERFAAAAEQFEAVLKIRPSEATATQFARRAQISGQLAQVREHDRSGKREEALTALTELQKRAPEDGDVCALVNEQVESLLAKVNDLNHSGNRAQTLAVLDDLRRLAPDGARVTALRDTIYDPRRAITNSIGMKFELIPAGEFMMGSDATDPDAFDSEFVDKAAGRKEKHRVRISSPFYLGVTEVTRGQFRRFVDDAGYRTEAEKDGKGGYCWNNETKKFEKNPRYTWQNHGFEQTDDHPVVNVSWNDSVAFAQWLSHKERTSYRLPTEAEWEYACRAGTTTRFSQGDNPEGLAVVGNVADGTAREKYPDWHLSIAARDGYVHTAPVGRFQPNAFGLHDLHGNVWEYCSDGYAADYYGRSPVDDPQGALEASDHVVRGGGWFNEPRWCRSAHRNWFPPEWRDYNAGFRLALIRFGR